MFSFAIQALDSFRERLKEWPEFCYHILQVPHIREAQNELVDFIMNIVKANHVADPNSVNDPNEPSVVALPSTVNAPRSVLQDSQDEIFISAFAAVDPAGNRFSSSQLRYLSGQVCFELCTRNSDIEAVRSIIEGYGYVRTTSFCFLKLFLMFTKWSVGYIFYVLFRNAYLD